jgi:ATP-dependent Clp protease ATP-binding subunit ClpC
MFENYTELARRTIFFARYEADQFGSDCIDTEHILMGLIRANAGVVARLFRDSEISASAVRAAIEDSNARRDKGSTSVGVEAVEGAGRRCPIREHGQG